MESVHTWTREYFLNNQEECLRKLKNGLTPEEKIGLRSNLNFKESGSLVLLNHFMITDVKEPEFYCNKYEVKKSDGSVRMEFGKYSDKLDIGENETCDPTSGSSDLAERQSCIITRSETNNGWVKEFECCSLNANKRKIENEGDEKSFLLKVYDTSEILLNQLVEVIGFLYATHSIVTDSMDNEGFNDENPKLPAYVIHAVVFKEQSHNNPILLDEVADEQQASIDEIQKDLLKLLTQFLFGDELAAHYVLCHMISKVYSRVNDEALGKFSINLICHAIPSDILVEYAKKLYNLFEILMPNSLYFPLTLENLNDSNFVPKKDYTTNNLESGVLQLPNHTHLFLDETKLQNGKLEQNGCLAVGHLSELIRNQQLSYDFQFYKLPFKTDIPVLIISEGKSLLPCDYLLTIKASDDDAIRLINENFTAGMHYMRSKLNTFRRYLTQCRLQNFDIGEEETKMIEIDFVKMRETLNFQVENLHLLLVLSRLLGISRGSTRLDNSCWESAKQLELERSSRMEKKVSNEQ